MGCLKKAVAPLPVRCAGRAPGILLGHWQDLEVWVQSAHSPHPQPQAHGSLAPDSQNSRQQINYNKTRGIYSNSPFSKSKEQTLLRFTGFAYQQNKGSQGMSLYMWE